MKIGDFVIKNGDSDEGMRGLIFEMYTNAVGTSYAAVIREDGICAAWFTKYLEVVYEAS